MTSSTLLLEGFDLIATFDDDATELAGADVLVSDGLIEQIGVGLRAGLAAGGEAAPDRVVDCRGLLALPGIINAHQHLYQGAARAVPSLERALIGPWLAGLGTLVRSWHEAGSFGPDVVRAVARAVLAESLLGGQTTVADQHYFHPAGATRPYVEATIEAAAEMGIRLHACRGSLTLGADPAVVQDVDEVVRHCAALIDAHHDAAPDAMVRVALAPCGVHADRPELFDELAVLAGDHDGVRLHTHLYEKVDTAACQARYGITPWQFLVVHGWAGPQTWIAPWSTRRRPRWPSSPPRGWEWPTWLHPTCAWVGGWRRCATCWRPGSRWGSGRPGRPATMEPICSVTCAWLRWPTAAPIPTTRPVGPRPGSCWDRPPAVRLPASAGPNSVRWRRVRWPTWRRGTFVPSTGSVFTTRWPASC